MVYYTIFTNGEGGKEVDGNGKSSISMLYYAVRSRPGSKLH